MSRIEPIIRLKLSRHVAPQIFEKKTKTPKFHIDALNLIEERYKYTAFAIFRGASKTTILNKNYIATEIFFRHEPFVQVVSKDHNKATGFTRDIKKMFQSMMLKGYAVTFGEKTADDHFEVIIDGVHKCIVVAIGAGEDPRGATADFMRPTLIVIDDLESKSGRYPVGNRKSREKLASWFDDDLLPGLHPKRGRVIFLGTILHKNSLLQRCMDDPMWASMNIPILQNGKSTWRSRFSLDEIMRIRDSYAKRGKLSNFSREYMNKPVADEQVLFKSEYFKHFSHIEFEDEVEVRKIENAQKSISITIKKPKNIVFFDGSKLPLSSCLIYTTMDVASGGEDGDKSAIVTCAYDGLGNRYVLEIKSGFWDPFEKGVYAIETYLTYNPLQFGIEEGGMQNDFHSSIAVLQLEEGVTIPVVGLKHKGVSKNVRIANMQPNFVQGKTWFNKSDPNTIVIEAQLEGFDVAVDSDDDDEMDALAYQEKFVTSSYDDVEDTDEEESVGLHNR